MAKIKGIPVRKLFSDSESGFKIYAVDVLESNSKIEYNKYGNISIKGYFFDFDIGAEYEFTITKDSKNNHDGSYNLVSIKRDMPQTYEDKLEFLSFSISDNQAKEVLKHYPDIIQLIMDNKINKIDTDKLYGIGDKTLEKISDKVIDTFCLMDLVVRFADYGLSHNDLKKLMDKHGSTETIIYKMETNPYDLLSSVNGIGFKKADGKIINAMPELKDSKERLAEAIKYILNNSNGDSAITEDALANRLSDFGYELRKRLIEYIEDGSINNINGVMYYNGYITTERLFNMAKYVFKKLLKMSKIDNVAHFDLDIENYRDLDGIQLTNEQLNTIKMMNDNNIGMLVGNAGSGKTASTKSYINFLKHNNQSYLISAFTGRASKVIADHTGEDATTIHRMLKYHPVKGWRINERNPLHANVLIIDEVSMASIDIMYRVMQGVDINKTKILLMADSAQLPSISHGNVLHDLVMSKLFPINRLNKVFRYGSGGISTVATDSRNGKPWIDSDVKELTIFGDNQDMIYIPKNGNEGLKTLVKTYKTLVDKYGVDEVISTTIYNTRKHGTRNINKLLQKVCNPKRDGVKEMVHGDRIFRVNDRVMNTSNLYGAAHLPKGLSIRDDMDEKYIRDIGIFDESKLDVYNGDIGKIIDIIGSYVIIDFDGINFIYSKSKLNHIVHGYCVSTHKLQGSESPYVLIFYPSSQSFMMNRNLIYVALTRGKEKVIMIAKPSTINKSLRKAEQFNRVTNLRNIIELFKERKRDKVG